ncbi:MAG: DEAD/DEAH box helicase family protein [Kiritimatiellae bacterium]|nr:DEAD/DEAH box helicase family protein [Kiritimatiellia bacterium]
MKKELFPFQNMAVWDMRKKAAEALGSYSRTGTPQILSLQAPTGSGKTIMMASLIEDILFGSSEVPPGEVGFVEQPEAIFVWLSDSPELNLQSKDKIDLGADRLSFGTTTLIEESSFDREMLEDGKIYFLNTQKLSVSGNLTKKSDRRQWTIWETLDNTAREKADRLYFIIDEAHRGMQGSEAGKASSIMQRFLKGYRKNGVEMRPMPFVIGMSATAERFNRLAEGLSSTIHKTIVSADQVRASGLLKDRILIGYPKDAAKQDDMALLGTATEEWMNKCAHWEQYCREQHYKNVDPVFVVQVKAGTGEAVSDTNLDDVIAKIEKRTGRQFSEWEVVHTFGSIGTITANGLNVHPVDPSRIADDRRIKVVLFKENLSTGWDCPRAETMMSFRTAKDYTYIAQLLGRMIRTPLQNRVKVDDSLNEVRLFLPYFDEQTVTKVIEELKSSECGDIPVVVEGEATGDAIMVPWSIYPRRRAVVMDPNQQTFVFNNETSPDATNPAVEPSPQQVPDQLHPMPIPSATTAARKEEEQTNVEQLPLPLEIDREAIIKAINTHGFITYVVRTTRITDYLQSLLQLSGLLARSGICPTAKSEVDSEIVERIRSYADGLRAQGRYDALAKEILEFKLAVMIFDAFGNQVQRTSQTEMMFTSESDLDPQLRAADMKLGNCGFSNKYGRKYATEDDTETYKIDVILYAANDANISELCKYAEQRFHELDDRYRRYVADKDERCQLEYNSIVANGDMVSKHIFMLGQTIGNGANSDGKCYTNHLYVDDSGVAMIRLNSWEDGVVEEEEQRGDFVCWLRNVSRASWALTIPYEIDGVSKPMYPDFIIVRRDAMAASGYAFDILEPHNPSLADNLQKAKGLAKYAQAETKFARIQLIRKIKDSSGKDKFNRLDFCKGEIRDKVLRAQTLEELNNIFDADGFIDCP